MSTDVNSPKLAPGRGGGSARVRSGVELHRVPGPAEKHPVRTARRLRLLDAGLGIGVPVVLLLLWQVASTVGVLDSRLFPAPTQIFGQLRVMIVEGVLWEHGWVTVRRTLLGFAFGSLAGIVVGLVTGMSRLVRSAIEPLLSALYTVPKLALLPVFLTIFGIGEVPMVMLVGVTVFFFVWVSTMTAVMAVPAGYREAAQTFQVDRWEMFRHVLFPGALPDILVGLRLSAAVSVLMIVGVEFVTANTGLGHLIQQGRTLMLLGQTYVGIVLVALFGYVFALSVRKIGRIFTPWVPEDNARTPM